MCPSLLRSGLPKLTGAAQFTDNGSLLGSKGDRGPTDQPDGPGYGGRQADGPSGVWGIGLVLGRSWHDSFTNPVIAIYRI